jgi:hypothetical protein
MTSTYTLSADGASITCLLCDRTSHHPSDVAEKYCGHCHIFHQHLRVGIESVRMGLHLLVPEGDHELLLARVLDLVKEARRASHV